VPEKHGLILSSGGVLTELDFAIGTGIALVMSTGFAFGSSGNSLLVTFIPGLAFSWLVFLWIYLRQIELPAADTFVPAFFSTLAIQFLHFGEEFATNFRIHFPALYGGAPYSANSFVIFNMVAYAVFTLACLLVFYSRVRFLLLPVLFFVIYGSLGNAISHTWWQIYTKAYFPGFYTALAYWLASPWLLNKLVGDKRTTAVVISAFAIVLVPLLTIFSNR
jgi:hypothetical protein